MKMSRSRLVSLFLVLAVLLCLATTAMAFTGNTYASASTQAELPPGMFFSDNLGDVSLVAKEYYYDKGLGCYIQSYGLSNASKLSLLIDTCLPIYLLQSEINQLKANNRLDTLNTIIESKQKVTIWDSLSKSTQTRLVNGQMNAQEALNYIRTSSAEYQSNSTLQRYVNFYLDELLSGKEARAILKIIDPNNARVYDDYNIAQIISTGERLLATRKASTLINNMSTFRNKTTTPYALEKNYSAQQLATYYANLYSAARVFYPDYVDNLESFRFVVRS